MRGRSRAGQILKQIWEGRVKVSSSDGPSPEGPRCWWGSL